jgi:SAM-dependent methyltransferase
MPASPRARYDGYADWYEEWSQPFVENTATAVRQLIGSGDGICLDVGCGGGAYLDALAMTGRTVVGLDRSADQLRFARRRSPYVLHGDAAALPFAAESFSAVAAIWISTDVEDCTVVLAEAARVLQPGGVLGFYGCHPCFNGPHIEWMDDGGAWAHPGYQQRGWHQRSPWWGPYVRSRVGMRHHPLAELLTGFIQARLLIEYTAELGDRPVPTILAIRARKPADPDARPRGRTGPFPS